MDRRLFIKVSGTAAAGLALSGCSPKRELKQEYVTGDFSGRIARDVSKMDPLTIKEITLKVGATKPFDVLHMSDTHIVRADNRDDERKALLAAARLRHMNAGEHYMDEAIRYANEHGMYMMHTGDLYDFVSEANLDFAASRMLAADWFVSAGNHEYSKYVGEAKEDEAYKDDSREAVQGAYPNDLTFASRVINGVNFVAIDDVYYNITEFCASELEACNGNCAYLTGVPLEITSKYDPGVTYPEGEEWRYRKVQQKSDKPTLEFVSWLKEQKLLKAILCGHCHRFFEERFSPTAVQYAVDATYNGGVHVVHFR